MTATKPAWAGRLLVLLRWVVGVYLVWLTISTALRVAFPWDLWVWSESPFMTNMLKLEVGQPLYAAPADANSFVYSPALELLTFGLLKPLGLHLDIRFCRLVNVGLGILAGIAAGICVRHTLRALAPDFRAGPFAWLGGGVAILVIFRNFTADVTHPDNLVMLHLTLLLLLTFMTVQTKSFGLGVLTMLFAAVGVWSKQILLLGFVGPALLFLRFNLWGWRRGILLAGVGALATGSMLGLLWAQPWARFYTLDVLSRQGLHLSQGYWILLDSLYAERGLLWALGVAAVLLLWRVRPTGWAYLQIWLAVGATSVWPNALSYFKQMGTWNNLIIFQLWLMLLVWPALGLRLSQVSSPAPSNSGDGTRFDILVASLLGVFVLLLLPTRLPPHASMRACCAAIQEKVRADLQAGRKILVAHGTMYQIRAGSRDLPLDRANSFLELDKAGLADQTRTLQRIRDRYYDRIYLVVPEWYSPAVLAEIEKNYVIDTVIKRPAISDRIELGRCLSLLGDCKVMSLRQGPK